MKSKAVGNIHSLDSAKLLAKQFVTELESEYDVKLEWWFIGSIKDGNYIPGKSDIDIIVIPKDNGFINPHILLEKMEDYKKYGQVWKKGRHISLIDVVLFFDTKMVNKLRKLRKMPALKEITEKKLNSIDRKHAIVDGKMHLTKAKNQTKYHLPKCYANCVCGKGTDEARWYKKTAKWIAAHSDELCLQCKPYIEVLSVELE